MTKRRSWVSVVLTLLSLAIVYGLGTTFFAIELERLVEQTITPRIVSSSAVSALNREISSGIDRFMASRHVRVIGYTCLALVVVLALAGLVVQRRKLAFLGSLGFILPTYGYFVMHMSFLAGLQILTALWAPFWGDVVRLGDIAYLPYVIVIYPFALAGVDIRRSVAGLFITLGLLIFVLGVMAWLYARFQRKEMADFWIYRFSRHPQYLGWILWSYGLMLRVALRTDTLLSRPNPGASLPWVISTLIIICIALSEEIHMRQEHGIAYTRYDSRAPFMIPMPALVAGVFSAPFRLLRSRRRPTTGWDLVWVFTIYLAAVCLLSIPFLAFNWPPGGSWSTWPF